MADPTIRIDPRPDERRVDVSAGGEPFTAYRYDDRPVLAKPVLLPLRAPSGAIVTRGYPLEPRPGERVDHRHHIGHSLTYGVEPGVDGVNFWGVSDAIPPDEETEKGRIRHRTVERAEGGDGRGELAVTMDWTRGDGRRILREETRFRFGASADRRTVDRITTLTAADGPVPMPDDKEGMFAVRVARGLEHPDDEAETVPDELVGPDGEPTDPPVPGTPEPTGEYLSSEGERGTDVWGTRAEWLRLAGSVDGDPVAITIMDHPDNVGFPTYWHARGYGLFAANPLGPAAFTDGAEELGFELGDGASTTVRYRLAIDAGTPNADALDARHRAFVDAY